MKIILIVLFLAVPPFLFSQTKDTVHLSFNTSKEIACFVTQKSNANAKNPASFYKKNTGL